MSCNSCGNTSQVSFTGETGVGIVSVSSAIVDSNIVFTFTYSDGSTSTASVAAPTNGTTGIQGLYGGWSSEWNFLDTTSGVTSGYLNFDSATYSTVTTIKVHDTNADNTNLDLFLDALSNSGNFGVIKIFKKDDSNVFWLGVVTNVVDSGSFHTLTVTYVLHNSAFALDNDVILTFAPTGADGATASSSNVGAGSQIYKSGTDAPFEFRTVTSPLGTLDITQGTDEVEMDVALNDWLEVSAIGTSPDTNKAIYQTPGSGFTSIANASGCNTVALKIDPITNKVIMKGACKLTGSGVIGFNPTGAASHSSVFICTLPVAYSTGIGVQAFPTAQLFNAASDHASTCLVNVSAGALTLIVDSQTNYLDNQTIISFENTMYSPNNS